MCVCVGEGTGGGVRGVVMFTEIKVVCVFSSLCDLMFV